MISYRPDIDGLRAIAVIAVLLYHANGSWLSGGFIGVDVFFVISGFLITGIIHADILAGKFSLVDFYERRIRRIMPALTVVTILSALIGFYIIPQNALNSFSMSIVGVATFTSNIIFWMQSGYFDSTSTIKPLIHTWSLAVEEQFYIIIPLLMMVLGLFKRSFLIWVFIGLSFFSLMLSEYASRLYPELNFYMLPTRMWELLAGSIVAIIYHQRNTRVFSSINLNKILSTASLLAVVLCLIFFNHDIRFPSLYAALPVYATALLLITSHPYTLSYKLLSNRLFVLIGLASYSIYLWHQPIFAFTRIFQQTVLSNNDIVLCLIATLLCGFLSWHFIEKPFRNRERFSQEFILIFGVLSLFFIGCLGIFGKFKHHIFPETNPAIIKINQHAVNLQDSLKNCLSPIHGFCTIGDISKQPSSLLWGDSHGGALAVGLNEILKENAQSAFVKTTGGCPALIGMTRMVNGIEDKKCTQFSKDFAANFEKISSDIDTIILAGRWDIYLEDYGTQWFDNTEGGIETNGDIALSSLQSPTVELTKNDREKALSDTIDYFINQGKTIILITSIPAMGWNVPDKLITDIRKGQTPDASIDYTIYEKTYANVHHIFDRYKNHPRVTIIKPDAILCDSFQTNRCAAITPDGIPLYFDDDHLSPYGAKLLSKEIIPYLK